jgi:murein DD-endopeptidase MepM/ murein hydrolase activator NlpD
MAPFGGVLGGPETDDASPLGINSAYSVLQAATPSFYESESSANLAIPDPTVFAYADPGTLQNLANSIGGLSADRNNLIVYHVSEGDTLSNIAANFSISTDTIRGANKSLGKTLKTGQEIIILPVNGILYEVKNGDTVEAIASLFHVDVQKIKSVNKLNSTGDLALGAQIVVPDGKLGKTLAVLAGESSAAPLQALDGYFIFPAPKNSWNWGILHAHNAVDIANACGTDIYAAQDGVVVDTGDPDGWNGGYGGFIELEHPNGTHTLYGHTEKNMVAVGTFITQGDTIAHIGRTGNVHGPTGCHLHFEVHGAKNPFVK